MPTALRLAAVAATLVLAGCAGPAAEPEAAAPSPTSSTAAPTTDPEPSPSAADSSEPTAEPVPATLSFRSTTVEGRPFDGASLAGKPVLLWFWAPWCPTCRSQIDDVQAVARDFAGKVSVVGVGSLSDDADAIKGFAADASGLTHLDDQSGEVFRHFGVVQQSSFVLLDARGEKVWSVGYGGSDDLAEQVAAAAG